MTEIKLTGLDGANPMGFMAALGVLNVLCDRMTGQGAPPRLAWVNEGYWRPVVHVEREEYEREHLIQDLITDLEEMKSDPALALEYGEEGARIRDLKPPPAIFRGYLLALAQSATPENRRSVDLAAAFGTDVAVDNNGNTKPTALHLTSGTQYFLGMVQKIMASVDRDDIDEALWGPWKYERKLPVLQWDSTVFREYALRACDPSGEKKTGVPGADWLAVRGLSFFRSVPRGNRILTACCHGGWKSTRMRWPLWGAALTREAVQTALLIPDLANLTGRCIVAYGIEVVLESSIKRADQGGRGTFSPAQVCLSR